MSNSILELPLLFGRILVDELRRKYSTNPEMLINLLNASISWLVEGEKESLARINLRFLRLRIRYGARSDRLFLSGSLKV